MCQTVIKCWSFAKPSSPENLHPLSFLFFFFYPQFHLCTQLILGNLWQLPPLPLNNDRIIRHTTSLLLMFKLRSVFSNKSYYTLSLLWRSSAILSQDAILWMTYKTFHTLLTTARNLPFLYLPLCGCLSVCLVSLRTIKDDHQLLCFSSSSSSGQSVQSSSCSWNTIPNANHVPHPAHVLYWNL